MTNTIKLKPYEGYEVTNPETGTKLPRDGATVARSTYWERRLAEGVVVDVTEATEETQVDTKSDDEQTGEGADTKSDEDKGGEETEKETKSDEEEETEEEKDGETSDSKDQEETTEAETKSEAKHGNSGRGGRRGNNK